MALMAWMASTALVGPVGLDGLDSWPTSNSAQLVVLTWPRLRIVAATGTCVLIVLLVLYVQQLAVVPLRWGLSQLPVAAHVT